MEVVLLDLASFADLGHQIGGQPEGNSVTGETFLRSSLISLEVNDAFSEAVILMRDNSKLCFCHRVDERWAKAEGTAETGGASLADQVLSMMMMFRLNSKHLEIEFQDGSRWESQFGSARKGP